MSKQIKVIYASFNTFALLGLCMFFLYVSFYLQFLAALHQSALYINLTYVLAGLLVALSVCSFVSGWKMALQQKPPTVLWKTLLWIPWVLTAVVVVALVCLVIFRVLL